MSPAQHFMGGSQPSPPSPSRLSPDVYHRPVLSMPPVILMGGGGGGGFSGSLMSIPPSPIVEMPPSPAPSQMMIIEFPDDDIAEVRFVFNFILLVFNLSNFSDLQNQKPKKGATTENFTFYYFYILGYCVCGFCMFLAFFCTHI